ncbi:MAG: hypothetical protein DRO00_01455 [Thermoproteota archaeon]|nr:MAG: hypothetical protein DRN92_05070 [Candidatus Korarchaeota archaeon]RLG54393.1 MAG: hypothetical protein DRO00_01455 [Candidatus Korarchaeota archaeon]
MRVREVHSVNLGKEEKQVIKFLFGLLKMDGCVDLTLTSISSKRKTQHVYRRISVKINDGSGYVPINSRIIAKTSVEFIIGDRVSADFLLTFSYYYRGEKSKKIRLADDVYVLTLRNNKGTICLELTPWHGLFRITPKAVLRMLLWEAGLLK